MTLLVTACGADNETSSGGTDSTGGGDAPSASAGLEGTLDGAGATSQEKAQDAWKTTVQGFNGGKLTINYGLVGSTDGRSQFIAGTTAFAGSDSYLKEDEDELAKAKERCGGTDPIEVPAYVSPIAIAFNLPGIDTLNLSPGVIADIFNNKITTWNDPAIAADNPDADLPDADISPVHRADDSGTTKNFTDYLGKAAPDNWPYEAEDAFPVSGGNSQAAQGTSGVIDLITGTENTIGYADESQVGDLGKVSVGVGDAFVAPSAEAAAKTVAVSTRVEGRSDVDMATDVDRTTTEDGAYPVILLSYLIACQQYDDPADAKNVKGYLSYIVSDAGQKLAAEEAGSAPLTPEVAAEAQGIVDKIVVN
ncbi:phosphate ABC transporter substrate-binding protein PstS [Nocardioides rubriscoriae]|uniref:phosphate ABC transporter substrate-binding protein PstS n=1 Tax=Nocardioides rubriscoriae TaxID=642762 RepID=UPI001FE2504C|nr:phosphate ABC transporter substrate-binding protein PstS [Nocardioides rubriscoriae]